MLKIFYIHIIVIFYVYYSEMLKIMLQR